MIPESLYDQPDLTEETAVSQLLNSLNTGIMLLGPAAEILFCNQAAQSMLEITSAEVSLKPLRALFTNAVKEDKSPFQEEDYPVLEAIRTRKNIENTVLGIETKSGSGLKWLQINVAPILDKDKRVQKLVCSFTDITAQKIAAEKMDWLYNSLESRAYELATLNTDLEKFIYVATHDLQEPLRRITSFVQLLERKYAKDLNEQTREYIRYVVDSSIHMKKLLRDLLEYAGLSGTRDHFRLVDMNSLIQRVLKEYEYRLIEIGAVVESGNHPVVFGDSVLLEKMIGKLIANAIKYKSESSLKIRISSAETEDAYIFSFTDNGIGIRPDYHEKIFNLFQRLHANEAIEGTGVGLAICQKIVRIHQGEIGVKETQPGGSQFWFSIPKIYSHDHEKL